jgi:hypothetical protein
VVHKLSSRVNRFVVAQLHKTLTMSLRTQDSARHLAADYFVALLKVSLANIGQMTNSNMYSLCSVLIDALRSHLRLRVFLQPR